MTARQLFDQCLYASVLGLAVAAFAACVSSKRAHADPPGDGRLRGEALAKAVIERCADGCAVMGEKEIAEFDASLKAVVGEVAERSRKEGAESCRMSYELRRDIPDRKFH